MKLMPVLKRNEDRWLFCMNQTFPLRWELYHALNGVDFHVSMVKSQLRWTGWWTE